MSTESEWWASRILGRSAMVSLMAPHLLTSATAQFSATDIGKVVTGSGIPAGTWIQTLSGPTSATLSAAATTSASGVAVTIQGTHQCSQAYTAWFGAGTVQANGQVAIQGWKDEAQLVVSGWNNQTSDLQQWKGNTNLLARVNYLGGISSSSNMAAFEGNTTYQVTLGSIGSPINKPGIAFGAPDAAITRDASGIIGIAAGLRLGTGYTTVAGSRLWSGSGAPNISASAAGDFYFRTDTPSTANQRIYVATATNTWTGIV